MFPQFLAGDMHLFLVTELIFRKSIQNLVEPSGLVTGTIGDDQGLTDGRITSFTNIFSTSSSMIYFFVSGTL